MAWRVSTEAMCSGDPKAAIEAYKAFQTEFPKSRRGELVAERIRALESPGGLAFYAWYAKTDRTPENRPLPKDLKRGDELDTDPFLDLGGKERATDPNRPPSPADPESVNSGEPARPFPTQESDLFPGKKPETVPATPEGAGKPETPETPETPAVPGTPATPAVPEGSEKPAAEAPAASTPATETPASTTPAATEAPQSAGTPAATEAGSEKPAAESPAGDAPAASTPATPSN